jgi:hypothetical protein
MWEATINATVAAAEKVGEDKQMKQVQDGKSHPTWLLGHLSFATSFPVLTVGLGKSPVVPMEWMKKFGPDFAGGQPIDSNAASYPSWEEILEGYQKSGAAAVTAIRELDDADLDGGAKGEVPETLKGMFDQLGKVLVSFIGHNAHHTGQLAQLAALD